MSTKYTNMTVQVVSRPPNEDGDVKHHVVVAVHFINAIPRIKGQARPKPGQCWAHVFEFFSRQDAESARALLEQAFDSMLPIVLQHGVLVPVDEIEQAATLLVPHGKIEP